MHDDPKEARREAEHIFTRLVLQDLMADLCMRADDPNAEASFRSTLALGAHQHIAGKNKGDITHRFVLREFETFWEAVERDVAARVSHGQQP